MMNPKERKQLKEFLAFCLGVEEDSPKCHLAYDLVQVMDSIGVDIDYNDILDCLEFEERCFDVPTIFSVDPTSNEDWEYLKQRVTTEKLWRYAMTLDAQDMLKNNVLYQAQPILDGMEGEKFHIQLDMESATFEVETPAIVGVDYRQAKSFPYSAATLVDLPRWAEEQQGRIEKELGANSVRYLLDKIKEILPADVQARYEAEGSSKRADLDALEIFLGNYLTPDVLEDAYLELLKVLKRIAQKCNLRITEVCNEYFDGLCMHQYYTQECMHLYDLRGVDPEERCDRLQNLVFDLAQAYIEHDYDLTMRAS